MALGKKNRIEAGKSYSVKLSLKDGQTFREIPAFIVSQKAPEGSDKKYETVGQETDISGDLVKLVVRQGEYEGSPTYTFTLGLFDPQVNEMYYTDIGLGSTVGRSLANSVLNLKAFDNVQLSAYKQINKETKKSYANVSLRQGETTATVKGKYDKKTHPEMQARQFEGKIDPATKKPKIEYDYTAVVLFLFEELKAFAAVVEANKPVAKTPTSTPTTPAPQATTSPDVPVDADAGADDDEQLPF